MNIVCSWHVANTFIKKAFEEGIYFTPLKLNCLIYLLYSNYLYNTGKALFNEPFLKTSKGPILVNIEAKFGSFKERKIFEYAKDSTGTVYLLSGDDFLASLLYIWNLYKNMSDIEMLTFLNNTRSFWKKKDNEIIYDAEILDDEIKINAELLRKARCNRKILEKELK